MERGTFLSLNVLLILLSSGTGAGTAPGTGNGAGIFAVHLNSCITS